MRGRWATLCACALMLACGDAETSPTPAGTVDAAGADFGVAFPGGGSDAPDGGGGGTAPFGAECAADADCASGACVDHHGGRVCSQACDGGCAGGWTCVEGLCRSQLPALCRPCRSAADCAANPGSAACVHLEGFGGFCGAACGGDAGCPQGWTCDQVTTVTGGVATQCVPADGACSCSAHAIDRGWSAWCPEQAGGCGGERLCTAAGLGPCLAGQAADETCNGVDDDCNGAVDEGTCDDFNDCTQDLCLGAQGCQHQALDGGVCGGVCMVDGVCAAGVCEGVPVLDCDDGNPCTKDSCNPAAGCDHQPQDGPCDDGSPCTTGDTCAQGVCVGEPGGGCTPGSMYEQPCGQCGTQSCGCTQGCEPGACGACENEGPCAPGAVGEESQPCAGCGLQTRTRTCGGDCQWSAWSDWGACQGGGGGVCSPGQQDQETADCGACGTQTRSRTCTAECGWGPWGDWGACGGEGVCSPGQTESEQGACGNCGTRSRSRTCSESCEWGGWGAWGSCGAEGVCAPGETSPSDCDPCAERTCTSSCEWGACDLKSGAACLWDNGSNWRCCGSGQWQFCLGPAYGCAWSTQCSTCSGCGC